MKPEITEITATVDGAECVFKREPKHEPPPLVVLPTGYDVSFDAREAWTVIEPGGREFRVKVPRGSDVERVREAAATDIRARNAMAFEILRGHLVGDWSGVYDHAFHEVYMAAGAERLLRGGGRHQRGMKSFA